MNSTVRGDRAPKGISAAIAEHRRLLSLAARARKSLEKLKVAHPHLADELPPEWPAGCAPEDPRRSDFERELKRRHEARKAAGITRCYSQFISARNEAAFCFDRLCTRQLKSAREASLLAHHVLRHLRTHVDCGDAGNIHYRNCKSLKDVDDLHHNRSYALDRASSALRRIAELERTVRTPRRKTPRRKSMLISKIAA
jgi:hypothetical protein